MTALDPQSDTAPTLDPSGVRRWRLLARVAESVTAFSDDFDALATTAADLISEEIGDGCGVVLLNADVPSFGLGYRDPEHLRLATRFKAELTGDDLREWVEDFRYTAERAGRGRTAGERHYMEVLAKHDAAVGVKYIAFARIRDHSGGVLGLIGCNRGSDGEPFSDFDLSALASVADAIGLGVEVVSARARERSINRLWATAFEISSSGHALLNLDGRIQSINEAGAEIIGRTINQVIGMHWRAVADDDVLEPDREDVRRLHAGERGAVRVRKMHRPDGTARWMSRSVSLVRDEQNAPEVIHVQFADVSDLYAAEARAEMFAALVESSPDFISYTSMEGRVQFINAAGRSLVGLPEDFDVTETVVADYHEAQYAGVQARLESWIEQGSWRGDSMLRDWRDGSLIPVSARTFIMRDAHTDQPVAIAAVMRDIRDQLTAQQAITDLAEQRRNLLVELVSAEQAERSRIANDVHDDAIQLLAAAQLRLQLLTNQLSTGDVEAAQRAATDISKLVSDSQRQLRHVLLDLESPNAPGRPIHEAMADTAASFFADTDTRVTVNGAMHDVPEEVAAVFYRTGREAVSNARRHARASHVTVTLGEDETRWRLLIVDDGIGVPDPIPVVPGHLGVRGMTNRVEALSGRCTISRSAEGGTSVLLEVPRR